MVQHEGGETLLSIGELAAASGLSPKALRIYAESGLLPPHEVDPFTGYRSYGTDQIERARLIAALRGIGMGLARIAVVCDLEPQAAAWELRSWWRQEEADASSRAETVDRLVRSFGGTSQEGIMTASTTSREAAPVRIGSAAHRGSERPTQQDAALTRRLPGGRVLIAVADGFGEPGPGDDLAARMLDAFAIAVEDAGPSAAPLAALEAAWPAATALIPSAGREHPGERAGSTLTAALLDGETVALAHIGDTRAVLVRGDRLELITQDHTRLRSLVAAGRLSPEEAASHPDRAVLNRALAAGAPTGPDLLMRRTEPGDLVVLLSDGVHAVVDPAALAAALTAEGAHEDPSALAGAIVDLALGAGAPDNIAVAVAALG